MFNDKIKGTVAGILIGTVLTAGGAIAKSSFETIQVEYDNIKVYKDNVLCELKDANGTVIEPFIYNGTTYMPVRGTANISGMDVTWEGSTKSVYLWDNMVPNGTYLMEVCPPYETSGSVYEFYSSEGESFEMAGEKYSNGIKLWNESTALFNLNSKYSAIECVVGHERDSDREQSVSFIVDGKTVKEINLEAECLPKTVSIPVNYGLQLKIVTSNSNRSYVGIGNITVR